MSAYKDNMRVDKNSAETSVKDYSQWVNALRKIRENLDSLGEIQNPSINHLSSLILINDRINNFTKSCGVEKNGSSDGTSVMDCSQWVNALRKIRENLDLLEKIKKPPFYHVSTLKLINDSIDQFTISCGVREDSPSEQQEK